MRRPDSLPLASAHLRIARPSRDLARTEGFWVAGLGLQVLERIQPHASPQGQTPPAPTGGDLLVLHLGQPADPALIQRMVNAGGQCR